MTIYFFQYFQDHLNSKRKLWRPIFDDLKSPIFDATRAQDDIKCQCTICQIARVSLKSGLINFNTHKGLPLEFWPLMFPHKVIPEPKGKTTVEKKCGGCGSLIGKDRSHKCTKATARANTIGIIRSMSLKSKERTTRDTLMNIFEDKGVKKSPSGSKTTLATGGRQVNIVYGGHSKASAKKRKWTKESLIKLQAALNLSDKKIK